MRPLLAALVFLGATVGALDVAGIAAAETHDAPWLAGALPAVFSTAGVIGGALFLRFQPANAPRPRHLAQLAALYALCWLPLLAPPAPLLLVAALLPGALFVPVLTVASITLTTLAPPAPPRKRWAGSPAPCAWAWPREPRSPPSEANSPSPLWRPRCAR
ncbi:hypothetical protein ACFQ60_02215 [Streptomyces zhihengii]